MNKEKMQKLLSSLKKPTLRIDLYVESDHSPNLASHFGGKPYLPEGERPPACPSCGKELSFVFQFYIPKESEYELFAFYYCFECKPERNGQEGFAVLKYENPQEGGGKGGEQAQALAPYCEFSFDPGWSVPDWESLGVFAPEALRDLYGENEERALEVYHETKNEMTHSEYYDNFSFFGGYPQFLQGCEFPACGCCAKPMKLWAQMDSPYEMGVEWGKLGCLYVFKCPEGNEEYSVSVQS